MRISCWSQCNDGLKEQMSFVGPTKNFSWDVTLLWFLGVISLLGSTILVQSNWKACMAIVSGRTLNLSFMLSPIIFWNPKRTISSSFSMRSSPVGPIGSFSTVCIPLAFFELGPKYWCKCCCIYCWLKAREVFWVSLFFSSCSVRLSFCFFVSCLIYLPGCWPYFAEYLPELSFWC